MTNVQRRIIGADTSSDISGEIKKVRTTGLPPFLKRAVVLDVIYDPDSLTEEEKNDLAQTVDNAEFIDIMPTNSVVARITSDGGGVIAQANTILFPFFSSHLMLPVKPGETVYVIEEEGGGNNTLGYWFTRICAQRTVEDTNFTHLDRRHDPSTNPINYSTTDKTKLSDEVPGPGFPNGANTPETLTLKYDESTETRIEPYEQIRETAKASPLINPEPVPRWRKRPQEYVLQGSNNTLICLGEDRTGGPESETDAKGQAGAIDVVVGRGRKIPASDTEEPEDTAPRVITNSRGLLETDKAPFRRDFTKKDNPKEGDPDFKNDASRILISMQTEGDTNFNLVLNPENSLKLPDVDGRDGTDNRAYIIGKSDHIRLIARKDEGKEIAGTILLVREGTSDEDLGYFYIDETGQIQIESNKIYMGMATGEEEPMILYTRFRETTMQLQAQINAIEARFTELCNAINKAFSTNFGNLGAPIPSLSAAATPVLNAATNLSDDLPGPRNNTEFESAYPQQSRKSFLEPEGD